MNNLLISPLVAQQLPDFVRSDYQKFTKFIEKYYEWMELTGNVVSESDNLRYAQDLDLASDYYIEQIQKEFLPFFPESLQLDKRTFLKLVNQFYSAKGTPDSVKFLFQALYNEKIDIYYPKDDILIASDGKWVLPLTLRIDTNDNNIFNIEKTLLVGQTSKATAVVERVFRSVDRQLGISYIEVYISNVSRLFTTGETVTATYNDGITDVTVSGRLIGSLSEIKIDANNRGLFYNAYDTVTGYPGDPVTIVGGLNPESNTPIGAIAYVGETTKGSITDIIVSNSGFGFRDPKLNLNSSIVDFKGGFEGSTFGTEAKADISLVDEEGVRVLTVSNETIEASLTLTLDQFSANGNVQNSTIANTTTYQTFPVYPLSFVVITGAGGGYRFKPSVDIYSYYLEENGDLLVGTGFNIVKGTTSITSSTVNFTTYFEVGDTARLFINNRYEEVKKVISVTPTTLSFEDTFSNDISGVTLYKILRSDIRDLGSLGRLQIIEGGTNYAVGEYLTFSGGTGYGANAQITQVHSSNNGIKAVEFNQVNGFIIGGEGYQSDALPTVDVNTVSGSGATIVVSEITGDGEQLELTTSRIGAISKLRVISYGYDYVSAPTISLRNADIIVTDVTPGQLFVSNTVVYQGASNTNSSFSAKVDKYEPTTGLLRVFDYRGTLNTALTLISDDNLVSGTVTSSQFYGDGRAKATASFENGLIRYPGIYLNTDGQLSSDKVLQDGVKYHNFSYVINTKQDYKSFSTVLNNVVHPLGTKTFITRTDTSTEYPSYSSVDYFIKTTTLPYTVNIVSGSNNMVTTNVSSNLASYVNVGDTLLLTNVYRPITGTANVENGSNTIIGLGVNFINDVQEGDTIYLSTGNTETIKSVVDANTIITQNTINVTSTSATINVLFDDTKVATFVNANTILVDTNFTTNSNFVVTYVQKVE